jgi:uncharacterized repeat protein (TIGR03803 family)
MSYSKKIGLGCALFAVMTIGASAQTVTYVHNFAGTTESAAPFYGTPVQGRDGHIYGTTFGRSPTFGSIFRVSTAGEFRQLHAFDNTNGGNPYGGLTLASDGNFYGTTTYGGSAGLGVLYRITPNGAYTVLHQFAGGSDGAMPYAPPIEGSDGHLYGTTSGLAQSGAESYPSTVYEYIRQSSTFSTVYQFAADGSQGEGVVAPLVQANDGNLYGTASFGGMTNCGTVFRLSTSGTLSYDYSFPCGAGGAFPFGGVVQGSDGNLYGVTEIGGNDYLGEGAGTVFKVDQNGVVSVLYIFPGFPREDVPVGGLMQATDGNLYGTTIEGGSANYGTLFQTATTGAAKELYHFPGYGENPALRAGFLQHTNGILYSTTSEGNAYHNNNDAAWGSVFSLSMGLGPFVSFVRPTGRVGQIAQILGQGLTGATSVTFNGVAATKFRVVSDTYMTAVVPAGATTGAVVVATPTRNLTSNVSFRISQ